MFRLEISLRCIRVSFLYVVLIVMIFLEKFLDIVCDFFVFSYQVTNNFYIVARYSDVFGIEEQFRVVPLDKFYTEHYSSKIFVNYPCCVRKRLVLMFFDKMNFIYFV